jgi:hypothetical protein
VQPIGSMSEKVAMLMHRAALNWDIGPQCGEGFVEAGRAVDDGKFRRPQATFFIGKCPSDGFALPAHHS